MPYPRKNSRVIRRSERLVRQVNSESSNSDSLSVPHLIGLIGGALCISFAPIFAVLSTDLSHVGMWDSAFWRVCIGAIAMGIFMAVTGGFRIRKRESASGKSGGLWLGWLWFPGVIFAADFWAWHWSFENTSVANSTLLANTAILWVTLFAWLVWKEKITKRFVFGASIAFGGMILLMLSSTNREPPRAGNPVFGDFLALLTAVFYATYQLSMKRYRRERSAPLLMFCASAVAAIVLFPLAFFHKAPLLPDSLIGWLPLIGLGVISHACGQGLIAWALGSLPSSSASVILLVQPVATAFLGKWILNQPLVPWQIAGATLVLVGLFFAIQGQVRRPRRAT